MIPKRRPGGQPCPGSTTNYAISFGIRGGSVTFPDGMVTVTLSSGAVAKDIDLAFTPLERWSWGASGMRVVNMFELKAVDVGTGAEVTSFSKDVEIKFQLSADYNRKELAGLDINTLDLYHFNTSTNSWQPLGGTASNVSPRTLTATTNHLSVFGSQAAPIIAGPLRWKSG